MNTVEALVAAKAVIADPENWCIKFVAIDKYGEPTGDVSAGVKFCAFGALMKVELGHDNLDFYDVEEYLNKSAAKVVPQAHDYIHANNISDHATVMEMFDLAIKMAIDKQNAV